MSEKKLNRRAFIKSSVLVSAAALSLEEKILLAKKSTKGKIKIPKNVKLPIGKINNIPISRLIIGGNLTSGSAHSRDLIYVSSLIKRYFTDEKIFQTWQIAEENGIDTAILRLDDKVIRLVNEYWNKKHGKLRWIVQIKPKKREIKHFKTDIKRAIDNGATGAYIQGGVADKLVRKGQISLIGEALEFIKEKKVIAGIGAHSLKVPVECEKAGFDPDFYMKTLHPDNYWSANPKEYREEPGGKKYKDHNKNHDNIWCINPDETIKFMEKVKKPWIAFKVLAAGAISPTKGFKYAFKNGADFICVGMTDFQIEDDTATAKSIFARDIKRKRPWMG